MKKAVFFLLFTTAVLLQSQDFEPYQIPFYFQNDSTYYLSADSAYFQQEEFMLGWAWSCGRNNYKNN